MLIHLLRLYPADMAIGELEHEHDYRGFKIIITRDWERKRKPYTVEWHDEENSFGPMPSPMYFNSEAAAMDKARELIDLQYRIESDEACEHFHEVKPKGGVKRWDQ